MTATVTETASSASTEEALYLRLNAYLPLLQELTEIQAAYKEWQDNLSLQLHAWMQETFSLIPTEGEEVEKIEKIDQIARERIGALRTILVNPLDKVPLTDPCLIEGEVYEKSDLDAYQTVSRYAPTSGAPLEISEHTFAKGLLDWIERCPEEAHSPDLTVALPKKEEQLRMWALTQLAQKAMQMRINTVLKEKISTTVVHCEQTLAAQKIENAIEVARADQRAKEQVAAVRDKVTALQTQHTAIVSRQERQLSDAEALQVQTVGELNAATAQIKEDEEQLRDLERELQNAKNRIAHLESELSDCDEGCTLL